MSARILAIDTTAEACSVALAVDGEPLAELTNEPRQHAERILPMVDRLLAAAGISLSQLDALAFGRGPGAFTGLRIAAGVVQGLALGADLPAIPVSSLAMLAHRGWREHRWPKCHAAFDARMGEVYWGSYVISGQGQVHNRGRECVAAPDQLMLQAGVSAEPGWCGVGSGWCYRHALEPLTGPLQGCDPTLTTHALDLLWLAQTAYAAGDTVMAEQVAPVYLRNQVAAKPKAVGGGGKERND
ncbi:MAG: tRNA (adenosine(37)-N6)-threonylcarbamoyltransferase complex dimerization subunit type 1 TsaB [Pseudomonadota bacterium]|nr:tRNA (adenosine(37)-N6)-threonylcarbamoyltransferase complex dimerization subunit type 1 TsaB [Pseudomonadota bacterium]